jgi:hypothetical protein
MFALDGGFSKSSPSLQQTNSNRRGILEDQTRRSHYSQAQQIVGYLFGFNTGLGCLFSFRLTAIRRHHTRKLDTAAVCCDGSPCSLEIQILVSRVPATPENGARRLQRAKLLPRSEDDAIGNKNEASGSTKPPPQALDPQTTDYPYSTFTSPEFSCSDTRQPVAVMPTSLTPALFWTSARRRDGAYPSPKARASSLFALVTPEDRAAAIRRIQQANRPPPLENDVAMNKGKTSLDTKMWQQALGDQEEQNLSSNDSEGPEFSLTSSLVAPQLPPKCLAHQFLALWRPNISRGDPLGLQIYRGHQSSILHHRK